MTWESLRLKQNIEKEKNLARQILSLTASLEGKTQRQRTVISSKINKLKKELKKINNEIGNTLERLRIEKPIKKLKVEEKDKGKKIKKLKEIEKKKISDIDEYPEIIQRLPQKKIVKKLPVSEEELELEGEFEKDVLKRIKKGEEKKEEKKIKKPNFYVKIANRFFYEKSLNLSKKKFFKPLKENLIKANMSIMPSSYISIILFTTLTILIISLILAVFLMFFKISPELPFISLVNEPFFTRFLKVFWIVFALPVASFLLLYFYPNLEKRSIESRINQELPFVIIHMSAIAGSKIEPSKIFKIVISTKEYPYTEREFVRLINEINVYGYDLVSALKDCADKSASKKLADLFKGLATTIVSGGSLIEFLDKRSQTLMLDYRLEREKNTKITETFMDIYISVVIAAPMILMLLLVLIKISNLGIGLSTGMLTFLIILGVSMINIIFLVFLHLKQPEV